MFGFMKRKAKEKPVQVALAMTDMQTDPVETNVRGQTLTSNACGGTNPDLPPQAAFREAPETPVLAETKPVRINRDCRIKIRFTPEELADVKQKAKEARTDCSKYIRGRLNAAVVLETPQPDFEMLTEKLIRVGRHLDDVLVRARASGFISVPELRVALDETSKVLREIHGYYEEGGSPNDTTAK